MQPGVIDGGMLEVIGQLLPNGVQHGTELSRFGQLIGIDAIRAGRVDVERCCGGACRGCLAGAVLHELADLLVECHSS